MPSWLTFIKIGGASLTSVLVSFCVSALLARILEPSDFGVFSSSLSVSVIMICLVGFGLPQFFLREAMRKKDIDLEVQSFQFLTKSFVFVCCFYLLLGIVLSKVYTVPQDLYVLIGLLFYILGQASVELGVCIGQSKQNYTSVALWHLYGPVSRLAIVVIVSYLADFNLAESAICFSLSGIFCYIRLYIEIRRGRRKLIKNQNSWLPNIDDMPFLRGGFPFGVVGILHVLLMQFNVVIVRFIDGADAGGFYAASLLIVTALSLFPSVVVQKVLMSKIHMLAIHDHLGLKTLNKRLALFLFTVGVVLSLVGYTLVNQIVELIFGEAYKGAKAYLAAMFLFVPLRYVSTVFGATLMTGNGVNMKMKDMAYVVLLNLAIIPFSIIVFGAEKIGYFQFIVELALLFFYWRSSTKLLEKAKYEIHA